MDHFQPKLIYLTRRHPSLGRTEFTARWRRHGQLGMSRPRWKNIARYVHCDIDLPGPGLQDILGDYDGIGMIWHRSPTHRTAHLADATSKAEMEADEAETFAAPIGQVCVLVREEVEQSPEAGASWKLVRFSSSSDVTAKPAGCIGLVRNRPLEPEAEDGWGLKCALIEEFWFASREAAEAAAPDLAHNSILILGQDVQLYP